MTAGEKRLEKDVPEETDREMVAGKMYGRDGETDPVWTDGGRVHARAAGRSGGDPD